MKGVCSFRAGHSYEALGRKIYRGGVVVDEIVDKGSDIIGAVKDKIGR